MLAPHPPVAVSDALLAAASLAARKHQGQFRKDGRTPYAAHPTRVALVAALEFGVRETDLLAAALLHDTIEDTSTDWDELAEQFGPRVADLVAALTKDKRLPEAEREACYHDALAAAPLEVRVLKLADVVDNLRDSRQRTAEQQAKTLLRAREVLDRFEPDWPAEWSHVLAVVRAAISGLEQAVHAPPAP